MRERKTVLAMGGVMGLAMAAAGLAAGGSVKRIPLETPARAGPRRKPRKTIKEVEVLKLSDSDKRALDAAEQKRQRKRAKRQLSEITEQKHD